MLKSWSEGGFPPGAPVCRAAYRNSRTQTHTYSQFRAWTESTWTQEEITESILHHSVSFSQLHPFFLRLRPSPDRTLLPSLPSFVPTVLLFFRDSHSCGSAISGFTPPLDHIACPSQENKLSAWAEMSAAEMSPSRTRVAAAFAVWGKKKKKRSLLFREPSSSSLRAGLRPSRGTLTRCVPDVPDCEFTPTGQSLLH